MVGAPPASQGFSDERRVTGEQDGSLRDPVILLQIELFDLFHRAAAPRTVSEVLHRRLERRGGYS